MLTEAKWQSQLVKCARQSYGGYSIRLSSLQRFGTPDLLLQLPGLPAAYIETKVVHYPNMERQPTSVTVEATPLQRETLRQIRLAGGLAGLWILVNDRLVLVTADPDARYLKIGECEQMLKERGRPWPIPALIARTVT